VWDIFHVERHITVKQIYILTIISAWSLPFTVTHEYHHTLQTSLVGSSPFRERVGSNRLPEKPRPRFEHVYVDDFSICCFMPSLTECCSFASSFFRFSVDYLGNGIFLFCLTSHGALYRITEQNTCIIMCLIQLIDFAKLVIVSKCFIFSSLKHLMLIIYLRLCE